MKFARLVAATAIATTLAALQLTPAFAETLRLSHNTNDTTTWQKGAEKFNELLKEKSGGELDIRIFPNAQLTGGDQMKQAEMVGRGAL
ncbi:MAG: C4-dicarboxylate ABC transporter, partial [Aurantimonas coralicida]|nr:C4-dicarboxylate ABC transporter [Aurantimonas coralicida]